MIAGDCNVIPHKILSTHINSKFFIKWFFLVCGLEMWEPPVGVDNNGIITNYQEGGVLQKYHVSIWWFGGSQDYRRRDPATEGRRKRKSLLTCVLSIIINHRFVGVFEVRL